MHIKRVSLNKTNGNSFALKGEVNFRVASGLFPFFLTNICFFSVFYCPVPTCNYTFGNTQAVHIHMSVHVRGRRMASVQASERLCPLCRIDMGSHEILVRHIVDDHDTRLECTEYVQYCSINITLYSS